MVDPALLHKYSAAFLPMNNYLIMDKYNQYQPNLIAGIINKDCMKDEINNSQQPPSQQNSQPNPQLNSQLILQLNTQHIPQPVTNSIPPVTSNEVNNSKAETEDDDEEESNSIDEVQTLTSEDLRNLTHDLSNYFCEMPEETKNEPTVLKYDPTEPCSSSFYSQLSSEQDATEKVEEIENKFRSEEYKGRVITGEIAEFVAKICLKYPRIRVLQIQEALINHFGPKGKMSKNNLARFINRHSLRDSLACRIKLDKEMEAALIAWRREDDTMSAAKLKRKLEETFPDRPKISTNRIYYLLRSYGIGKYVTEKQEAEEVDNEPLSEEKLKNMKFNGYIIDQEIGEYIGQMCLNNPEMTYKEMSEKLIAKFGYRASISSHGISDFVKRHRLKMKHNQEMIALEEEVEVAIVQLRQQNPYITGAEIKLNINERFSGRRRVNSAYVSRVLNNHGLKKVLKKEKKLELKRNKLRIKMEHKIDMIMLREEKQKERKTGGQIELIREGESESVCGKSMTKTFPCHLCDCRI